MTSRLPDYVTPRAVDSLDRIRSDYSSGVNEALGITPPASPATDSDQWVIGLTKEIAKFNEPSAPSYSSAAGDQYDRVRVLAKDAYGFSSVAMTSDRTNWAAAKFKAEMGRWPSATELWSYTPYQNTLQLLASGGAYMEPFFGFRGEDGGTQWVINNGLEWTQPSIGSLLAGIGAIGANLQNLTVHQDLAAMLASLSPVRQPSGGGGGGAGRAALVFDRAQLAEEATNRWRGLLLEEPDQATLDSIVNGYVTDANGFWMKEAGRLDFDTYVLNKIRAQDRHSYLYKKKPEFQSESEYMGGFRQTVGQFGMGSRATLRETEAGAHSGVGLAGFGERVEKTREARLINSGTYSQKFASSMAQSGIGRT